MKGGGTSLITVGKVADSYVPITLDSRTAAFAVEDRCARARETSARYRSVDGVGRSCVIDVTGRRVACVWGDFGNGFQGVGNK